MNFDDWCTKAESTIRGHQLQTLAVEPTKTETGIAVTASVVPRHYVSQEHIARMLRRLGKTAAASLIETKLPTSTTIRSGDLGEIYASEWINCCSDGYQTAINRLRWRDHRNMAMRGEDAIGIFIDPSTDRVHFLKVEAKSRASLNTQVVTEAREALDKEDGLPSAHALSYIAERLLELGNEELADVIDDALEKVGIRAGDVRHLMFTFSGNDPQRFLSAPLHNHEGEIPQIAVGLQVSGHAGFISAVYDQVVKNACDD